MQDAVYGKVRLDPHQGLVNPRGLVLFAGPKIQKQQVPHRRAKAGGAVVRGLVMGDGRGVILAPDRHQT